MKISMKSNNQSMYFLLSIVVCMLALVNPAQASNWYWDFSNGLDHNNFTFSSDRLSDIFLDESGGNLRIYSNVFGVIPSSVQGGNISSQFKVNGDFEISIDYSLNKALDSGTQVQLGLSNLALVRSNEPGVGGNNYHVWYPNVIKGLTSTSDTTGTFRLVRIGSNLASYVNSSLIYNYIDYGSGDMGFGFNVQANGFSGWNGGRLNATYDNLRVTANALVDFTPSNSVPAPPTIFLIAPFLTFLRSKRGKAQ